ncbi:response regulator [uncultured Mucilaginibacter sp.]|uniref:response regulator n=1 Tax=uncultured Mucilaginibacter sp. TaxID=797541 RepID=UPI0025F43556|nr:response regulator [uncultured Mucilaginibacter sp.]
MKTILIIEDNADIREGTAEILGLSGYRVIEADNGKTGVELAIAHQPDLILCDIMMPELDGYGVLLRLSKNLHTQAIPFIFLTAKAERVDHRKGMELGADDYLTKPFDDVELLNAIESRLQKKQKLEIYYSRSLENLERLAEGNGKGIKELKSMIAGRKIRQIKKKQTLFYDGDQPQGLYLVIEGNIKTTKMAPDGRELITGIYQADDYLGLHGLLLEADHAETAEALDDSAVCLLPKDMVTELLYKYPDLGRQFFKILANNIREKEDQLIELAYLSVRKRMANVLLRLNKYAGGQQQISASREELASMAGIASETVSRTLTDFKEEGIIEKKGSLIQILSIERLEKMKN